MPNVNDMNIQQASAILQDIVQQATGQATINAASVGDFVSVATTALKTARDPVFNALTQMWGRTIFAVRPYREKFASLYMDMDRWAAVTRKISFADTATENDQRFTWPVAFDSNQNPATGNGQSVDMYKIHKDDPLETKFYGQAVYQDIRTEFLSSLETAFRDPAEFMRYNAAAVLNRANKLAQYRENIGRGLTLNLIGSLYYIANALSPLGDPSRVIHLLTEYNTELGLTGDDALTAQTVMQPDNYPAFTRWVYARIGNLIDLMSERSTMYQTTVNGKVINRHTGAEDMRIFILSKYLRQMDSMAKSVTFHDDLLQLGTVESVAFWQSIKQPDAVGLDNTISLPQADGDPLTTAVAAAGADPLTGVYGVIFDRDALGYAMTREASYVSPFNISGEYWNTAMHANFKAIQDTTEKSVLLLLN